MGYYGNVNGDLLALIPPDAKTVLEIGCGEGALCEAYRRINPGVEWIGVERDEEASKAAQLRGVDAAWSTAEEWAEMLEPGGEGLADCLIFGDVLEHLENPWRVLERLSEDIRPGGQCLASIPNVQHWTVIRDLLAGHWTYTDSGLLDRTHLRFFALESIRAMFEQAGLQVHEIRGRDICNEGFDEFSQVLQEIGPEAYESIGTSLNEIWKTSRAYQYIVRAIKPVPATDNSGTPLTIHSYPCVKAVDKLHIHAVTAEDCCARPRIREPLAMIATIPGVKVTIDPVIPREASIVILQRQRKMRYTYSSLINIDGCILVAEIDDLPEAIGMSPLALQAVHAVQCSTEALADIIRPLNPNVLVFPNQIAELPPAKLSASVIPVRIFFGAQNREADWAPIMPAFLRVIEGRKDIEVHVVHDRKFYDAIPNYMADKHFHEFLPYAAYRALLRQCDIALLPLEDTPFNRCKSSLKFLECAAEGVLAVMQDTAYWQDHKAAGCQSGLVYLSPDGFEEHLRAAITDHALRQRLVTNAYAYVRENRLLSQHYRKLHEWYLSLINSRQALHADLLRRCPELHEPVEGTSPRDLVATRP